MADEPHRLAHPFRGKKPNIFEGCHATWRGPCHSLYWVSLCPECPNSAGDVRWCPLRRVGVSPAAAASALPLLCERQLTSSSVPSRDKLHHRSPTRAVTPSPERKGRLVPCRCGGTPLSRCRRLLIALACRTQPGSRTGRGAVVSQAALTELWPLGWLPNRAGPQERPVGAHYIGLSGTLPIRPRG
jgi:hypothetical protein